MTADQAIVKTVEHAEASRLPEPQWFWRRWLIYGCTVSALVLLSAVVWAVLRHVPPDLPTYRLIIRYCFYTVWSAVILYGVGASVTDVAQLVSAVKTTRKETVTSAPPPATISTPEATVAAKPAAGVVADQAPWERGQ